MVTTFENPTAVEFINEMAAEPDWAMSATLPGRTLSVIVDG